MIVGGRNTISHRPGGPMTVKVLAEILHDAFFEDTGEFPDTPVWPMNRWLAVAREATIALECEKSVLDSHS